ncbi:MAG: D-alanyl-D-alanine carboxypeptidase/D-alanyl-D-alanine-endopeptidase, partial [Acidobacteriota bacterium]
DLEDDLTGQLDRIRRRFRLNRAIGVMVQSAETGETLYTHNSSTAFVPASGMKLVTMAAALHYLGSHHRFETRLLVDGPIESGVLRANLYLKGTGDPTLGGADLDQITSALAHAGIREIDGNLILDDSFFDDRAHGASYNKERLRRGLPIQSALCYNANVVELRARPAEKSGARALLFDGGYGYFKVINRVKTASRGRPWLRIRKRRNNRVVVSGRVIAGGEERIGRVAATDPPAYLASAFVGKLGEGGIAFHGRVERRQAESSRLRTLYVHRSARLIQILELLGKESSNFAAEQILKALGAHRWGEPGSFDAGARALDEYLLGLGLSKDEFRIKDGSGLSYDNRLSPAVLARVLEELFHTPEVRTEFLCSLAVGGVDGTLRRRFRNERHMGRILAKTGSLSGTSSLSGFAFSPRRGLVLFSIIMNGIRRQWRADQIEDEIARTLLGT